MRVDLPPGRHSVRMVFETPAEDYVGRGITLAALVLAVALGLGPLSLHQKTKRVG
jgi:hypothetical protein